MGIIFRKMTSVNIVPPGNVIRNDSSLSYPESWMDDNTRQLWDEKRRNNENYDGEGILWSSNIADTLPIKTDLKELVKYPPSTLIDIFARNVSLHAEKNSLLWKGPNSKVYDRIWTWQQYWDDCCSFAKSCIKLGVQDLQTVSIQSYNRPQYFFSMMGTIFAHGVTVGIYNTNGYDAIEFILSHSKVYIAVVESAHNLQHTVNARKSGACPSLRYIVVLQEELPESVKNEEDIFTYKEFMELGKDVDESQVDERMALAKPSGCCGIVYTSGTTGQLKGCMLTHDNCSWTSCAFGDNLRYDSDTTLISYLPLSHIASQCTDVYASLCKACTVYFATADALKGELFDTILEVQPSTFFSVPRIWEKLEVRASHIIQNMRDAKGERLVNWALDVGKRDKDDQLFKGATPSLAYTVADKLVLKKIREQLGLGKVTVGLVGSAPLPVASAELFSSIGMPLMDLYGMSECTAPECGNRMYYGGCCKGSVGKGYPSTDLWLSEADENGVGELCIRGRNVMMGYLNNEEQTRKTIDANGFLHTGDQGFIDPEGFVHLTGRLKEIIVTSGGENVPPVPIEERVKKEMPFVSNVQVIGDQQRFVAALVCLQSIPENGQSSQTLTSAARELLEAGGSSATTLAESSTCPLAAKCLIPFFAKVNEKATSNAQKVKKWYLLPEDFSAAGGELTPSQKLRRKEVEKKYAAAIDEIYWMISS
eukprot:Platyproteum_vivax@DN2908_c0_g1_i1.p1